MSPRQKMINLMYIVLTAMLALNVSSDVLEGFVQVEEGLSRSNQNIAARNNAIYNRLEEFAIQNPSKGQIWFDKAKQVRQRTEKLHQLMDSLKTAIAIEADGPDADPRNLVNQDDLESASLVMLKPGKRRGGTHLRTSIDVYREFLATLFADSVHRANIRAALATEAVAKSGNAMPIPWEESLFEGKPVVAAVTMLTKLQSDVRYAEGETLAALLNNVDAGDVRVNELNAFVIPQSRNVMRGSRYSANIVLAAVDTTQRPVVYINGTRLQNDNGLYETVPGSTGTFDYKGYLEVPHGDGTVTRQIGRAHV